MTGDDTAPLPSNAIRAHPDFRMIVLANRPGFPFLGNDFFGALGKSFYTILLFIATGKTVPKCTLFGFSLVEVRRVQIVIDIAVFN